MDDLVKKEPEQLAEKHNKTSDGFSIANERRKDNSAVPGLLNKLFQLVNIADIAQSIKAGAEYVVQVPQEFMSALESGDVWMMENSKNGKMWPTLMRVAENGKNEIVTPLPIKRQEFIQGNPIQDLSSGFHNIYMQQQMQAVFDMVAESLETAKRIEQGQKSDRIGLLVSGHSQIIVALKKEDKDDKKQSLALAQKSISDGCGQVYTALQNKVVQFEPIPQSRFKRLLQMAKNSSCYAKRDDEYIEIQEYLNLYIQGTRMWAASCALAGDMGAAEAVFETSAGRLTDIDFRALRTIEYTHPGEEFEKVYNKPEQYIAAEKKSFEIELQEHKGVTISISGDELLEMISDGREEISG